MKKLFVLIAFFVSFAAFFVSSVAASDIGDVTVRFCKEDGSLQKAVRYDVSPGETKEICLKMFNDSDEEANVLVGFVDGTVTNDDSQYKACKLAEDTQNFGQFASIDDNTLTIPPRGSKKKMFTVSYPEGYAGMSYGCVVTQTVDSQDIDGGGIFSIELRKGNFIDIYVDGEIVLDLHFGQPEKEFGENITLQENEIYVSENVTNEGLASIILLANSGNVAQEAIISKITYTWFGEERIENLGVRKILPGDSARIIAPVSLEFWQKGVVLERYKIFYKPLFDYESDSLTEDLRRERTITIRNKYLIIPWEMLGIAFGVILLVVILVDRLRRGRLIRLAKRKNAKTNKSSTGRRRAKPTKTARKATTKTRTKQE